MAAASTKRGSAVSNKDHKTPGKDWRGTKSKPADNSDGGAAPAAAGDGSGSGSGSGSGDAAGEKKFKFRNEDKPRSENCYVCGKAGHRAEACPIIQDLQRRFNAFVQKQKNKSVQY